MGSPTEMGLVEAVTSIDHSDILRDDEGKANLASIANLPESSLLENVVADPNHPIMGGYQAWPFGQGKRPLTLRDREIVEALQKKHNPQNRRGYKIEILAVNEVLSTTKRVRQVCYEIPDDENMHYTWLFEANKDQLWKEFKIMLIADKAGIPTGNIDRHMMNLTEAPKYDFVLVDESPHTVSSYYNLLKDLRRSPERMQHCANVVAEMLSKVHVKLTATAEEFGRYEVEVPEQRVVREIYDTFLAGLHVGIEGIKERSNAWVLLDEFRSLARRTNNALVISHGDVHGNNIRSARGKKVRGMDHFRLIDWGTLEWANPYSDLMDLWLHHLRYAVSVSEVPYTQGFRSVESSYFSSARKDCMITGLEPTPHVDAYDRAFFFVEKNVCEILDPMRDPGQESQFKGQFHLYQARVGLRHLTKLGTPEAEKIDYVLCKMCREVPFLKGIADKAMD